MDGRLRSSVVPALAWLLAALAVLGPSVLARAQPSVEARYRDTIAEAVSEFEGGHFEEAFALFRQAHALIPNARTLRGMGMAAFEVRRYPDAVRDLSAALTERNRALTAEQRAEVQALLVRAQGFVGRFRISVTPSDAAVTLDGNPLQLEPDGSLMLQIGTYQLAASAPGRSPATRPIQVDGGEDETITLVVEEPTHVVETAPDHVEGTPDHLGDEHTTRRRRRARVEHRSSTGGVVLVVTGGALVVGSLASAIWWQDRNRELARCDAGGCSNEDTLRFQRGLSVALTIGFGAGALVTGIAGAVVLTSGGDDEEPADAEAASIGCSPTLGGVTCAGRF